LESKTDRIHLLSKPSSTYFSAEEIPAKPAGTSFKFGEYVHEYATFALFSLEMYTK
jgi:hypothetical protein